MRDSDNADDLPIAAEYECVRKTSQGNTPMYLVELLSEGGQFGEDCKHAFDF